MLVPVGPVLLAVGQPVVRHVQQGRLELVWPCCLRFAPLASFRLLERPTAQLAPSTHSTARLAARRPMPRRVRLVSIVIPLPAI